MPIRPLIDFAVIQQRFDGVDFDEKIAPCRIIVFGESPGAQVRASVWVKPGYVDPNNMRERLPKEEGGILWPGDFVDIDHLTDATVEDEGGTSLRIVGTSDMLRDLVGVSEGENRVVEWLIDVRGCQGCG